MPFFECVRKTVLEPAGMTETWAKVPAERIADCQHYDREHRIENGRYILREGLRRGIPHDPKAAVLQGDTGDLCGHAGLFSTMDDMIRFCRAVLAGKIVSRESLREMAVNRTGRILPDGTHTQYLGYQCYVRHPEQYWSEIPVYMGARAFGIGGFTGNHVSLDPERGVFCVFLGNRVKDRLTALIPEGGKTLTDYGLNPDGTGVFRWDDGEEIPSSDLYVHQKDEHLHKTIAHVLGLEYLPFL
jgi:CubicO group peptidase (beta-lactamase class C family)